MDLVSRLKQYLSSCGISITQFADECEIPRPSASQLLAGRNKKVSDEIIGKIHYTYPDLNISWLMFGEGDMTSDGNIATTMLKNDKTHGVINTENPDLQSSTAQENNLFSSNINQPENSNQPVTPSRGFPYTPNTFAFSPEAEIHTGGIAQPTQPQRQPEMSAIPDSRIHVEIPQQYTPGVNTSSYRKETSTPSHSTIQYQAQGSQPSSPSQPAPRPITVTPGPGKCVTGIVVYYSDSTYESFVPDQDAKPSFLR